MADAVSKDADDPSCIGVGGAFLCFAPFADRISFVNSSTVFGPISTPAHSAGIASIARLPTMVSRVAFGTGLPASSHSGFAGFDARSSIQPATCARSSVAGNADRSCIESSSRSRRALRASIVVRTTSPSA